ncbi:MAG TPA: NADH-quinone oxidoreductase subunit N [Thermoanaerobaculia bacterium]|nr:NADH-quinone oxidoreductase subunit N [Thermoanaerobaculia bacterium]
MTGFVNVTGADVAAVAPELVLVGAGTLLVLLDAFARPLRPWFPYLALGATVLAAAVGPSEAGVFFSGALEVSTLTRYVELLTAAALLLAVLGGAGLLRRDGRDQGEFYALLLWSASGLLLMVKGSDLLIVFIGLELMSLSLYVLAAWYRTIPAAAEAGMKYFLMGSLASAFLLYGIAVVYGRLGTTRLDRIASLARPGSATAGAAGTSPIPFDVVLSIGILGVIVALGFKIALVPFHSWAPDVYQGMTTPAVAFLSTAPKAGAAIVLVRFLHALFPLGLGAPWRPVLAILAVLSILFGNVVALAQRDVKRILAYSGIAQMGYLAIGLATFTDDAIEAVLVFAGAYVVTNAAAFLAAGALSAGEKEPHALGDLAGRGRERPLAATVLSLAMISLTGVPPTVGFLGKLLVFRAAVDAGMVPLALVGVFGSIVSVGYYLRVVYFLWMKEPASDAPEAVPEDFLSGVAFLSAAFVMVLVGIFPRALLELARGAAGVLSSSR